MTGDHASEAPGRRGASPWGADGRRPTVLVLDVNETLSDMAPMGDRFAEVGAPSALAATWFAATLRDGFALAAAGTNEAFATVATGALHVALDGLPLDRPREDAVRHVMSGFTQLPAHLDVSDGLRALARQGFRLVTLSNGSVSVAEDLLVRSEVRPYVEHVLSVEDAPAWKPAAAAYAHALARCDVAAADAMLVAVHPWDVDGASRAGLATAWVDRVGRPYPGYLRPPDVTVGSLTALAEAMAG